MKKIIWVLEMPLHSLGFDIQIWKIKKQIKEGGKVTVLACNSSVQACFVNPLGSKTICRYCVKHVKDSLHGIGAEVIHMRSLDIKREREKVALQNNLGAESTFISSFRLKPSETNSKILLDKYQLMRRGAIIIGKNLDYIFRERSYDELWTFNGRLNISKAAVDEAKKVNIDYYLLEVNGRDYKINITKNASNHDPAVMAQKFKEILNQSSRAQVRTGGENFYKAKKIGSWVNDRVYAVPQENPPDLSYLGKIDLLCLLSSEDETAALGPSWNQFYTSQEEVCVYIKKQRPEWNIVVRFHPNQGDINRSILKQKIKLLESFGIKVFHPSAEVSSYDLLEYAEDILTFGSTIGVEAIYRGKKVLQVGIAFYSEMKIIKQANSYTELMNFLENSKKIAIKRYRALAYGYYLMEYSSELCNLPYMTNYFKARPVLHCNAFIKNYSKLLGIISKILSSRPLKI